MTASPGELYAIGEDFLAQIKHFSDSERSAVAVSLVTAVIRDMPDDLRGRMIVRMVEVILATALRVRL